MSTKTYVTCPHCTREFETTDVSGRMVTLCDACGAESDPYACAHVEMTSYDGYRFVVRVCPTCITTARPIIKLSELAEAARVQRRGGVR